MSKRKKGGVASQIPIRDLVVVEGFNPRGEVKKKGADFEGLKRSIKERGILQPILVGLPGPTGKYPIIDGHRRHAAASQLRLKELPALVREIPELEGEFAGEAFVAAFAANVNREDMSPLQEARAISRAHTDFGMTQEDIATATGKTSRWVRGREGLLSLPASIQRGIESGELPITAGKHLGPIAKFSPKGAERIVHATKSRGVVYGPESLVSRGVVGVLLQELVAADSIPGLLSVGLNERQYLPEELPLGKAKKRKLAKYFADLPKAKQHPISFDEGDALEAAKRRSLLEYPFTPPESSYESRSQYIADEELIVELAMRKLEAVDAGAEPPDGSRPRRRKRGRDALQAEPSSAKPSSAGGSAGSTDPRTRRSERHQIDLTRGEIEDGLAGEKSRDGESFHRKLRQALRN